MSWVSHRSWKGNKQRENMKTFVVRNRGKMSEEDLGFEQRFENETAIKTKVWTALSESYIKFTMEKDS